MMRIWSLVILMLMMVMEVRAVTSTKTITISETSSDSGSRSDSQSSSLTSSKTTTRSQSLSNSRTATVSQSLSESITVGYHINYTTALEPAALFEGQEFRIQLHAYYDNNYVEHFNTSDDNNLQTRGYQFIQFRGHNCSSYTTYESPLWETFGFGFTQQEYSEGNRFVGKAHVTAVAPPGEFVICFKHKLKGIEFNYNDQWMVFTTEGLFDSQLSSLLYNRTYSEPPGQWKFKSEESGIYYNLPEAKRGQHAIIEFTSLETSWNFSRTPATCLTCGKGDSIKIVPRGTACTYEHQSYTRDYLGTSHIEANSDWDSESLIGLVEGTHSGGAGVFGTPDVNPTVSNESLIHNEISGDNPQKTYAYLIIPESNTQLEYEICFSSADQRLSLISQNRSLDSLPAWRKIWPSGTHVKSLNNLHFTTSSFNIFWDSSDLSPGSWGLIRVSSLNNDLSRAPQTIRSLTTRRWLRLGGDSMKIIKTNKFSVGSGIANIGSFTQQGCWDADDDDSVLSNSPNSFTRESRVIGSTDLTSFQFDGSSSSDASLVATTFAQIYFSQPQDSYFVCYRRASVQNSGWLVLPFGSSLQSTSQFTPLHLYPFGSILVPGLYSLNATYFYPKWEMNDTRDGSWGSIIIQHGNRTRDFSIQGGKWSYVMNTGTAVRIIPYNYPCDYEHFINDPLLGTVEATLSGQADCILSEESIKNCLGRNDATPSDSHHIYLSIPTINRNPYRVCLRYGNRNWISDDFKSLIVQPPSNISIWYQDAPFDSNVVFSSSTLNPPLHYLVFGISSEVDSDDINNQLTADHLTDESSGDIFRLVPFENSCDISLFDFDDSKIDTFLSLWCPSYPHRTIFSTSPCSSVVYNNKNLLLNTSERKREFLRRTNGIIPYNQFVPGKIRWMFAKNLIASVSVPGDVGVYKVCYKQSVLPNWISLNITLTVIDGLQSSKITSPSTETVLTAGSFQKFVINMPTKISLLTDQGFNPQSDSGKQLIEGTPVLIKSTSQFGAVAMKLPSGQYVVNLFSYSTTSEFSINSETWTGDASDLEIPQQHLLNDFDTNTTRPGLMNHFHAKFVSNLVGCRQPAADLENYPFGASTDIAINAHTVNDFAFYLSIPHEAKKYLLCVQVNQKSTWLQLGTYTVRDNGIRHSLSWSPRMRGVIKMVFIRCNWDNVIKRCGRSLETFNTSAGGDAVKLLRYDQPCYGPSSNGQLENPIGHRLYGSSNNVDNKGEVFSDLGPFDGRSSDATISLRIPNSDISENYKICLRSLVKSTDSSPFWIEIASVTGSLVTSLRSPVLGWTLSRQLIASTDAMKVFKDSKGHKYYNVFEGLHTHILIPEDDDNNVTTSGFYISIDEQLSEGRISQLTPGEFKIVRLSDHSSCHSSASLSTAAGDVELSFIPSIESTNNMSYVQIHMGFPFERDSLYIFCYKLPEVLHGNKNEPWLELWDSSSTVRGVRVVGNQLSFEGIINSVKVKDLTVSSEGLPQSSWCSHSKIVNTGVWCVESEGDFLFIANRSDRCPHPGSVNPPSTWWPLTRQNNVSVTTTSALFKLPPTERSLSGQYRMCLLKRSQSEAEVINNKYNLQGPLVYQIRNSGSTDSGGGSGYYKEQSVVTDKLDVEIGSEISFNESIQFIKTNQQTESLYSRLDLELDDDGQLQSNTPSVQTGSIISFTVRPSSRGIPLPSGNYPVWVQKCYSAMTWAGITCSSLYPFDVSGDFDMEGVDGSCASSEESFVRYKWPSGGLKQLLIEGTVTFRFRITSSCYLPTGGINVPNVGCGFRFLALPPGHTSGNVGGATGEVVSDPIWINTLRHVPNSIQINGTSVVPNQISQTCSDSNVLCPLLYCYHNEDCIVVINSLYNGAREHAPLGRLSITLSTNAADITESSAFVKQVNTTLLHLPLRSVSWFRGGVYEYHFTPFIMSELIDGGSLFVNVSYGESYSRFRLEINRRIPSQLFITSFACVELFNNSQNISIVTNTLSNLNPPVWIPSDGSFNGLSEGRSSWNAAKGSYVMALLPYQINFIARDVTGKIVTDFTGWTATVQIADSNGNFINKNAILAPTADPNLNIFTTEEATTLLQPRTLSESDFAMEMLEGNIAPYMLRFRVFHNLGCSRFKGGCQIQLLLSRLNTPTIVTAVIQTPVRVAASTCEASYTFSSNPGIGVLSSGIGVSITPGTWMSRNSENSFLIDEYHFAKVFAILSVPELQHHSGVVIQDYLKSFTESDTSFSLETTLRTTHPCVNCSVSFHTSWGATSSVELPLTLADDTNSLQCSGGGIVFDRMLNKSLPFLINITAVNYEKIPTLWSGWPITNISVSTGQLLYNNSSPITLIKGHVSIADLYLIQTEDSIVDLSVPVEISVRINKTIYSSELKGSVITNYEELSCLFNMSMSVDGSTVVDQSELQITVSSCEGCNDFNITTDNNISQPISISATTPSVQLKFSLKGNVPGISSSGGNLTRFLAFRSESSKDRSVQPWSCSTTTQSCLVENSFVLNSTHSNINANGTSLTYGSVSVSSITWEDVDIADIPPWESNATFIIELSQVRLDPTIRITPPVWEAILELCLCERSESSIGVYKVISCRQVAITSAFEGITRTKLPTKQTIIISDNTNSDIPLIPGLPSISLTTPSCGYAGGGTVSMIEIKAAVVYIFSEVAHIVYDNSYSFTLKHNSAGIVKLYDINTGSETSSIKVVVNSKSSTRGIATFLFSVLDNIRYQIAAPFYIKVKSLSSELLEDMNSEVLTAGDHWSKYPTVVPYKDFIISDVVSEDTNCPQNVRMSKEEQGYRIYDKFPASGWRQSASVGLPFPIEVTLVDQNNNRAWGSDNNIILIEKKSWSGCNDGGIITSFITSNNNKLDFSLQHSFIRTTQHRLSNGHALVWISASEPCEACVFEVTLCYSKATSSSNCLTVESDSDGPIEQKRTKITKPYDITPAADDTVVITQQNLPVDRSEGSTSNKVLIRTGDPISITYDSVQTFNGWLLKGLPTQTNPNTFTLTVSTFWTDHLSGNQWNTLKYGAGGFLHPGVGKCGHKTREVNRIIATHKEIDAVPVDKKISFYFTRPCSSCGIKLSIQVNGISKEIIMKDYKLTSIGESGVSTEPILFAVRSCRFESVIVGFPPPTVNQKTGFITSTVSVDYNRNPIWESITPKQSDFNLDTPGANGGGGRVIHHFHSTEETNSVWVSYSMPCYLCRFTLFGKGRAVSIHSKPSKIIVTNTTRRTDNSYDISFYVADNNDNRCYGIGGPTALIQQQLYQQGHRSGVLISLKQNRSSSGLVKASETLPSGRRRNVLISKGHPTVEIKQRLYNGIPITKHMSGVKKGSWDVGFITASLSNEHSESIPVEISFGGFDNLKTVDVLGRDVTIEWSHPANKIVITPSGEISSRANSLLLITVSFIYLFSEDSSTPLAIRGHPFNSSSLNESKIVKATWDCSQCVDGTHPCHYNLQSESFIEGSTAVFSVMFYSGYGSCHVLFNYKNMSATASVLIQQQSSQKWFWKSTKTLILSEGSAVAAPHHPQQLLYELYGNDIFQTVFWSKIPKLDWSSSTTAAITRIRSGFQSFPAKCFVLEDVVFTVPENKTSIQVFGYFNQPSSSSGLCNISIKGTPAGSDISFFTTTVLPVKGIKFTDATFNTKGKMLKAIIGKPLNINIKTIDITGNKHLGDYYTNVKLLKPIKNEITLENDYIHISNATAIKGNVVIKVIIKKEGYYRWVVSVADSNSYLVLPVIKSSHEVEKVLIEVRQSISIGWLPYEFNMNIVSGFVLSFRIVAFNYLGGRFMSNDTISIRPGDVPCLLVDSSGTPPYVSTTCLAVGISSCSLQIVPPCTAASKSWFLSSAEGASGDDFTLQNGIAVIKKAFYSGPVGLTSLVLSAVDFGDPYYRLALQFVGQEVAGFSFQGIPCFLNNCPLQVNSAFKNVTEQRKISDPQSVVLYGLRAIPGVAFSVEVGLIDKGNNTVLGDSSSFIELVAECLDSRVPNNTFDVGVISTGVLDTTTPWSVVPLSEGIGTVYNLAFIGWCGMAVFKLRCLSDPLIDITSSCGKFITTTSVFEVGDTIIIPTDSPTAGTAIKVPIVQIDVGDTPLRSLNFISIESALLKSTAANLQSPELLSSIRITWACRIGRSPLSGGISENLKLTSACLENIGNTTNRNKYEPLAVSCLGGCSTVLETEILVGSAIGSYSEVVDAFIAAIEDPNSEIRTLPGLNITNSSVVMTLLPKPTPVPTLPRPVPTPLPSLATPLPDSIVSYSGVDEVNPVIYFIILLQLVLVVG